MIIGYDHFAEELADIIELRERTSGAWGIRLDDKSGEVGIARLYDLKSQTP